MSAKTDLLLKQAREIENPSEELQAAIKAFEGVKNIKATHSEFKDLSELVKDCKAKGVDTDTTTAPADTTTAPAEYEGLKAGDELVNIGKNKHCIGGTIVDTGEGYALTEEDLKNEILMKKVIRAKEVGVLESAAD